MLEKRIKNLYLLRLCYNKNLVRVSPEIVKSSTYQFDPKTPWRLLFGSRSGKDVIYDLGGDVYLTWEYRGNQKLSNNRTEEDPAIMGG